MSEEITKEQVKQPAKARKPRATTKAAEESKVIKDVQVVAQQATDINEEGQKVIVGSNKKQTRSPASNLVSKEEGAISSKAADRALNRDNKKEEKPKETKKDEKVALWSSKNIRWTGTGTLVKGYNIVTKEAAEKWLGKQGIRKATPEEVATYYGK